MCDVIEIQKCYSEKAFEMYLIFIPTQVYEPCVVVFEETLYCDFDQLTMAKGIIRCRSVHVSVLYVHVCDFFAFEHVIPKWLNIINAPQYLYIAVSLTCVCTFSVLTRCILLPILSTSDVNKKICSIHRIKALSRIFVIMETISQQCCNLCQREVVVK